MEHAVSHHETKPGEKQWRCDQCASTFHRLDHLRRHSLTHNAERSHVCHFCGALFNRGDALRRHWKSCKTRLDNDQEIPQGLRGGKHKRACDSCASIRKACNGDSPCGECVHRNRVCTYQRLYEDVDGPGYTPDSGMHSQPVLDDCFNKGIHETGMESTWDLGHQFFYSSSREIGLIVYSRNRYGT